MRTCGAGATSGRPGTEFIEKNLQGEIRTSSFFPPWVDQATRQTARGTHRSHTRDTDAPLGSWPRAATNTPCASWAEQYEHRWLISLLIAVLIAFF